MAALSRQQVLVAVEFGCMLNKYSLKMVIMLQKVFKIDVIGTAQAYKWYTCLYNN